MTIFKSPMVWGLLEYTECFITQRLLDHPGGLYSLFNIFPVIKSIRMRWAGHVARLGERRGVCRILVGKPEGKIPFRRPRRRWEDNIKIDLQEVGCGGTDWIELAKDRVRLRALVNAVMDLQVE
jgi:hypothetical protein